MKNKTNMGENNRPKLHFTPKENWMNDPNGLLYDANTGKYHMFYQYSKDVNNDGVLYWGHAESADLIHWTDKGVAVEPNEWGLAYSGSGIIDEKNVSGLFDGVPEKSRMMLFIAYHSQTPSVGMCYSTDLGKTWKVYSKQMIANENGKYGGEFRDPKVFYYDDGAGGGTWAMITGGFTAARLFTSDNLLDWRENSEIHYADGKILETECPDLFPLSVNGDENNKKWVLTLGGVSFVVGELKIQNGNLVFIPESTPRKIFDSAKLWQCVGEPYATQSYFNDKYGRRILVSWMIDRTADKVDGKCYNGVQTLPLETKLIERNGVYDLRLYPVDEVGKSRGENVHETDGLTLAKGETKEIKNLKNSFDFELKMNACKLQGITLTFDRQGGNYIKLCYDGISRKCSLEVNSPKVFDTYKIDVGVLSYSQEFSLRAVIDNSAFEIFINGGERTLCGFSFSEGEKTDITLTAEEECNLKNMSVHYFKD